MIYDKTILIIGDAGFIGFYLIDQFFVGIIHMMKLSE